MFKNLPKKKIIALATILCVTVATAVASIATGFALTSKKTLAATVVTNEDPLFSTDGSFNSILAEQLMTLANSASVGSLFGAGAGAIGTANGGPLPSVKLFQSLGGGATSGSGTTEQIFSNQSWRLAYISRMWDSEPVFTFTMEGAYRNSTFNSSSCNYGTSAIRTNLNNDFDTVLENFPNATDYIVTPANLSNGWQSNQVNVQYSTSNWANQQSLTGAAANDLIWLPSYIELVNNGLWKLGQSERSYSTNGFSSYAWLRSVRAVSDSTTNQSNAMRMSDAGDLGGTGTSGYAGVTNNYAVCPAIHISLSGTYEKSDILDNVLFETNGTKNTGLSGYLMQLANSAEKTTKTTAGTTEHLSSDAAQIRAVNCGSLPTLKLFESVGTFRAQGVSGDSWAQNISYLPWRLSYITWDNGNPIFTFWASQAYRNAGRSSPNGPTTSTMPSDFNNMLETYFDSTVTSYIVSPNQMSENSRWQTNQSDTFAGITGNSMSGDRLDDLIWVPSPAEIYSTTGLWNLTSAERSYNANGFSCSSGLFSTSESTQAWIRGNSGQTVQPNGTLSGGMTMLNASFNARPAIHISLTSLEETCQCPGGPHGNVYIVTKEPTCMETGKTRRYCDSTKGGCGLPFGPVLNQPAALGHLKVGTWNTDTCEQQRTVTCSRLGCGFTAIETRISHNWSSWVVHPTECERYRECTRITCDETETQEYHSPFTEWEYVQEGKCTQTRTCVKCLTCTKCAEIKEETRTVHKYDNPEWTVTKEPTCTTTGTQENMCTRCNTKQTKSIPRLDHRWSEDIYFIPWLPWDPWDPLEEPPTMAECGTRVYAVCECELCALTTNWYGTYFDEEFGPGYTWFCGDLINCPTCRCPHEFGDWEVIKAPSCFELGWERRVCTNECGMFEQRSIEREHVWGESCFELYQNGPCDYTEVEYQVCMQENCYVTRELSSNNFTVHDIPEWDETHITLNPTCTEPGSRTRVCANGCGEFQTESIDALGHNMIDNWEIVPGSAPTCSGVGLEERFCTQCGENRETRAVDPSGCTPGELLETTSPTCTTDGIKTQHCTVCEELLYSEPGTPAFGHSMPEWNETHVTEDPTCENLGSCTRFCDNGCGKFETQSIPVTGHDWPETWTEVTPPTCTEKGSEKRTCTNPGCTETQTRDIPATGHKGTWTLVTPPTCTDEGSEERICTTCTQTETRPIPATGHNLPETWTQVTPPTYTEKGSETRACQNPGCTYTETRDKPVLPRVGDPSGGLDPKWIGLIVGGSVLLIGIILVLVILLSMSSHRKQAAISGQGQDLRHKQETLTKQRDTVQKKLQDLNNKGGSAKSIVEHEAKLIGLDREIGNLQQQIDAQEKK